MGDATRVVAADAVRTNGLAVLKPERLLEYAATWRQLADFWKWLGADRQGERGARLRRAAQAALYAANEIDELLKRR